MCKWIFTKNAWKKLSGKKENYRVNAFKSTNEHILISKYHKKVPQKSFRWSPKSNHFIQYMNNFKLLHNLIYRNFSHELSIRFGNLKKGNDKFWEQILACKNENFCVIQNIWRMVEFSTLKQLIQKYLKLDEQKRKC